MSNSKNFLTRGQFYRLAKELEANADEYRRLTRKVAHARLSKVLDFALTEDNVRGAAQEVGLAFQPERQSPKRYTERLNHHAERLNSHAGAINAHAERFEKNEFDIGFEHDTNVAQNQLLAELKQRIEALEAIVTAPAQPQSEQA